MRRYIARLALPGLALVLLLLFTGVAQSQEVMELEPEDMGSVDDEPETTYGLEGSQAATLLREGRQLAEEEEYLSAALQFDDIVENADPEASTTKEARYNLGVALLKLDLHQSALLQFEPIVEEGEEHPKYRQTLQNLLFIARATDADTSVLSRIEDYSPDVYPPDFRDELHFLVGQYHFGEGNLDAALLRFAEVSEKDSDLFVRAQYLSGVVLSQHTKLQIDPEKADAQQLKRAAQAFKAVLREQKSGTSSETVERVSAMATLALGRLFFSTRQYAVAVRYYDQVTQDDEDWLESLFEVSWVYFQLKN